MNDLQYFTVLQAEGGAQRPNAVRSGLPAPGGARCG
jgi:hypothetical protein